MLLQQDEFCPVFGNDSSEQLVWKPVSMIRNKIFGWA